MMKPSKKSSSPRKRYPPNSFKGKLKKRRILETLAAFIGGGWLTWEAVHWILVEHYHFPEKLMDITLISLISGLFCTITWRWFGSIKTPRKIKVEFILIPLVILITVFFDIRFVLQMGESETVILRKKGLDPNRIAVAVFENETGNPGLDHLGRMAHDWITQGLLQTGDISVASRIPDKREEKQEEPDFIR